MKAMPVADCIWEVPPSEKPGMLVPARIYASELLLRGIAAVPSIVLGTVEIAPHLGLPDPGLR